MLLISIIVKKLSRPTNVSTLLITFAALVSGGVSIPCQVLQHSWLLTTWMGICLVFVTYFSGNLTSQVISPSPEFRFSSIKDIVANNYSLVVTQFTIGVMKYEVETSGRVDRNKILRKLISTVVVANYDDIPKILVTKLNTSTISILSHAFRKINIAQRFQKVNGANNKHCYIGKELLFDESIFLFVTSRKIKNLQRTLRVLMEQGIFHVWIQEYVGISGSPRVQGRSRIISSTKYREDPKNPRH